MMKADTKACLAVISLTYAATAWLGLQNFLLKKKQILFLKKFYWSRVDLECCASFRCIEK